MRLLQKTFAICDDEDMKIYRLNQAEFRLWRDHAARTELIKKIHSDRGPTQVRAPSGVILGTARGTSERVPIERARIRGAHHAVSPGECVCREWQKPAGKEAEHHPICRLKSAWEAQLAHSPDLPRPRAITTMATPLPEKQKSISAASEQAVAAEVQVVDAKDDEVQVVDAKEDEVPTEPATPAPLRRVLTPAPDPVDCICRDWAGTPDDRHHPICQFRERWEREHDIPAPLLIDLETGETAREATADEAAVSKAKAAEDGLGTIELSDGKLYYVRQP